MKIYSYVVAYDGGFAPNPFWGYCTLATCKPKIRRVAKKGDWVIGTGSVRNVGNDRLVYTMKVTEVMPLEEYGSDTRFVNKVPGKGAKRSVGDNVYYRDKNGVVRRRFPSEHSYMNGENLKTKRRDLNGKNVLISKSGNFYYFGEKAVEIPHYLSCLIKKGPNHKCNFPQDVIRRSLEWIRQYNPGICGNPSDYPKTAKSCTRTQKECTVKSCQ